MQVETGRYAESLTAMKRAEQSGLQDRFRLEYSHPSSFKLCRLEHVYVLRPTMLFAN